MRRRPLLLVGMLVVVAVGGIGLVRAATSTIAAHVGEQRIMAECTGWTGLSDRCREWGEEVLGRGAPSNTFEIEDVVRVRLDRPLFGFAPTCAVEYFLSRYPDEVAWTEQVPCFDG